MKKMKGGRTRRTAAEWKRIIHRFLESGLDDKEFCRREELVQSNFTRWRRQVSSPPAAKFVPLTPAAAPAPERSLRSGWELDVSLPGGVHLQFRG